MARVAVGGFQHETNTFAPMKADYTAFETPDAWPGLIVGDDIRPAVAGANIPIAGAIEGLDADGHEVIPLVWCDAQPSAHVTEEAYERIVAMLLERVVDQGPFDGIYLDLHGAMVTEHLNDGEGELLRRVRDEVGASVPVVASLDLHANVGPPMVEQADLLTAYRTYPHIDMAATGIRSAHALERMLRASTTPVGAIRQLPFLIPMPWQCTFDEPAKSIYARLAEIERDSGAALSFACGFPLADVPDCGPAVFAFADSLADADYAADTLADLVGGHRSEFTGRVWAPAEGVAEALRRSDGATGPVVLADATDNAGAGASSGTVALLTELIRQGASGAVFGLLFDPQAAAVAHEAGEGTTLSLRLGVESYVADDPPVEADFRVMRLGDGRFTGTGPFYHGAHMDLGPMALLRHESGVMVVVSARRQQAADGEMFRHLGVEPAAVPILVVKSSVHYRADFEPIADSLLVVDGPGAAPIDFTRLVFTHLRPEVRALLE